MKAEENEIKLEIRDCIMDARMGNVNLEESCKYIFGKLDEYHQSQLQQIIGQVEGLKGIELDNVEALLPKDLVLSILKQHKDV